jgi:hypothetical protein
MLAVAEVQERLLAVLAVLAAAEMAQFITVTEVLALLTEAVAVAGRLVIMPPGNKQAVLVVQALLFFVIQAHLEI